LLLDTLERLLLPLSLNHPTGLSFNVQNIIGSTETEFFFAKSDGMASTKTVLFTRRSYGPPCRHQLLVDDFARKNFQ
jgi:hypothetical protein